MACISLEEPRGSLPLPSTPSGRELCASWHGAPGAGYSLCLWPGRGWGRGCSGEQSGRCLGDQILSQEARGLARQSPGAQDWISGGVEEVDGAGSWVGHQGFSPKNLTLAARESPEKEYLACHYIALTGSFCAPLPRLLRVWESLLLN